MKAIFKNSHMENCSALRQVEIGHWDNPWYFRGTVWLAKDGTNKGRNVRFLDFGCNCAAGRNCPAQMLVREDDVIQEALK